MPQSNAIFFFVFAAFFVFITLRGELPKYLGFLFLSPTAAPTPGPTITGGTVQQAVSAAASNPAVIGALF